MANEKVDVVIVGAGASGSVYANVLTKAGKKVVLFDNGPDWQLTDLISSVPEVRLKWRCRSIVVYRSHLGRGGARYEPLETFPLVG